MSATLVTAPAAGWYHDPNDSGSWRWWDGSTWTGHVRPKVDTAPVAVAPPMSQPVAVQEPAISQPVAIQQPVAPAPPVKPVSLTPETPASEQEYWHSAAAEIVPIPGRSATSQHGALRSGSGGFAASAYAKSWREVGSPQTAGIWLLASLPIISFALQLALGFIFGLVQGTTGVGITPPNIVFYVIVVALGWVFAGLDVKALGEHGYPAPKIWWMLLLPPLVYFIVRGKIVRREGQRAWPPELLYFLSILGFTIIGVVFALFVMSFAGGLSGIFPA